MIEVAKTLTEIKSDKTLPHNNSSESQTEVDLISVCKKELQKQDQKPTIRIIHHFACSGGTLVSKCVSALPNTFLLSELHPTSTLHIYSEKPAFMPTDVITMSRHANIPDLEDLAWKIFNANIAIANTHVESRGGHLVIRDHTHSDYCVGNKYVKRSSIVTNLEQDFNILRIATIRNPIDSYASLIKNGWEHHSPKGFEEYCKRFNSFVAEFNRHDIIKYEDIVRRPKYYIKRIARKLDLPYNDSFIDTFSAFKVTGDSGRASEKIEQRPRREMSPELKKEIRRSKSYKKIAKKFNYN
ncbi:hypothetical protein ACUNWE_19690 [Alteromonas sp. 1036]